MADSVISTCLKCGKAPGIDSLTAEHFVNVHPSVVVHLTRLFNLILKHGYAPNENQNQRKETKAITDEHAECVHRVIILSPMYLLTYSSSGTSVQG